MKLDYLAEEVEAQHASAVKNRDLAITTDFRDIFAELLTKQLGIASLKSVFPHYDPKPRGLMA